MYVYYDKESQHTQAYTLRYNFIDKSFWHIAHMDYVCVRRIRTGVTSRIAVKVRRCVSRAPYLENYNWKENLSQTNARIASFFYYHCKRILQVTKKTPLPSFLHFDIRIIFVTRSGRRNCCPKISKPDDTRRQPLSIDVVKIELFPPLSFWDFISMSNRRQR